MTTTNQPHARITGAGELIAAIPHLLGFHPHDSLVLVGLHRGALVVTARIDLSDADERPQCVDDAIEAIVRGGSSQIIGALFADVDPRTTPPLPHRGLVYRLAASARHAGAQLISTLLIHDERWWDYACGDRDCCPSDGVALPSTTGAFAAAAAYAGVVVADSRAALAQHLAPQPDREALTEALGQAETATGVAARMGWLALHDRSSQEAIFAAARALAVPGEGAYPGRHDTARYGVALSRTTVRDAVWSAVDDGTLDDDSLWLDLARRLPAPYDAPALFLYGWRAWRKGNGALAAMAAERALDSDPGYTAADLLLAVLASGTNPRTFPTLRPPGTAGGSHRDQG